MKTVLGRKQNLRPEDEAKVWDVFNNIEEYVSEEECEEYAQKAIGHIHEVTSGKKAGYSWSGGKDSLVLSDICRRAGITECQCLITDCEFPAWKEWMEKNAPEGCEIKYVGFGNDFLKDHPELIFAKGKTKQVWNRLVQRRHFLSFMREKSLDVLCIGHRTIDGNFCGKEGLVVRKATGKILMAPLYDWPHEVLFAYMHYHGMEMPFIYRWYRGFYEGTHWWPYRYADSVEEGYKEVYGIDPSVVREAAKVIPSAKAFLASIGEEVEA